MAIRDFFKSTLKLAAAICLSVVALSVLGGIVWYVVDLKAKDEAKQYEVIKEWAVDLKSNLGLQLKARTKVVDGKMFMALRFDGFPAYLSDPRQFAKNKDEKFLLQFQDHDGFKVYEKSLTVSELSSVVDGQGKKTGMSHQFEEFIGSIDQYKRFAELRVQWTLDTEVPPPTKLIPFAEAVFLDHCAPKLSKAERLKRLAQYGTVRETGYEQYSAGDKTLNVSNDGTLIYCQ